ncbi:MAG: DJ-1 family glyoxalase III [Lachnospiraceae bacterium]
MKKIGVFFATGFEEIEALCVVDLCRRAGIETKMVSITKEKIVTSSHDVKVVTEYLIEEIEFDELDMIVLPGGIPGTPNLLSCKELTEQLKEFYVSKKYIAAICAAPTILGELGILKEEKATCYAGLEEQLNCKEAVDEKVVVSNQIITSKGMGTSIEFALAIIECLFTKEEANDIAKKILFR